jgi:putative ubiquitin-RnfH superfamily antitoxin RatB of RatAB toxin-antitoxin module
MAGAEPGAEGDAVAGSVGHGTRGAGVIDDQVDGMVKVLVAWSPAPRRVEQRRLSLPAGSVVGAALAACAEAVQASGLDLQALQPAVWARRVAPDQLLRQGDRLELCRGLLVDPKEARRLRYQGHRAQGLTRGRRVAPPA